MRTGLNAILLTPQLGICQRELKTRSTLETVRIGITVGQLGGANGRAVQLRWRQGNFTAVSTILKGREEEK